MDNSYKWAGGGFLSTVDDLLKFAHIMLYSFQATEIKSNDGKEVVYIFKVQRVRVENSYYFLYPRNSRLPKNALSEKANHTRDVDWSSYGS